jgi:gluconate kinase
MKLILLTGIPGTGKTTIGRCLADERGFRHLDFEDGVSLPAMARYGDRGFRQQVAALKQRGESVVVSWGFVPDAQLPLVKLMRSLGFQWVWLDGDRQAARRAFLARGNVPEHLLDIQMDKIERYIDLAALRPRTVNPFDDRGAFRPLGDVARDVVGG